MTVVHPLSTTESSIAPDMPLKAVRLKKTREARRRIVAVEPMLENFCFDGVVFHGFNLPQRDHEVKDFRPMNVHRSVKMRNSGNQ
jgi:hypothetical protein